MRLFIVRHGETNWNRDGRFQGQFDTELSELGLSQADKLADYLRGKEFDAIVTSPLARARVTAEKIRAAAFAGEFEVDGDLTEICHGDWEGKTYDEVVAIWPDMMREWQTAPHTVVMPGEGGESLRAVQIRAQQCVERIKSRWSGDVLLATHDAVIKALLLGFLSAPLSAFWSMRIANCSLSIAELEPGKPPLVSLVSDFHYLGIGFSAPVQKGV